MTEKRDLPNWEELYQKEPVETMPWFLDSLDHDVDKALNRLCLNSGDVLDLGTGPGTQAIALSKMGFTVTATDLSKSAIEKAKQRSRDRNCQIDFLVDDILNSQLDKKFDLVIDRGCFHTMHAEQRQDFIKAISNLVKPKGYLFLKCFSHLETRERGPYRFSPEEITSFFGSQFKIHSIEDSLFHGVDEDKPKALFCVMEK